MTIDAPRSCRMSSASSPISYDPTPDEDQTRGADSSFDLYAVLNRNIQQIRTIISRHTMIIIIITMHAVLTWNELQPYLQP